MFDPFNDICNGSVLNFVVALVSETEHFTFPWKSISKLCSKEPPKQKDSSWNIAGKSIEIDISFRVDSIEV